MAEGNERVEGGCPEPVSNLELVRILQDAKVLRSRKIEVAYEFVRNQQNVADGDFVGRRNLEVRSGQIYSIAMPQFVSYLSEWVQSAILWSSKPQQLAKAPPSHLAGEESEILVPALLDFRCWCILSWCLSSAYMQTISSVSPSLMRSVNLYVVYLLGAVDISGTSVDAEVMSRKPLLSDESVRSVEILLLANERSFRPDLDHWVSLAATALSKLTSSSKSIFNTEDKYMTSVRQLLVSILEGFARFVAIHPNRRKIFTSIVENLLESLLISRACLSSQRRDSADNVLITKMESWYERLLKAVEDIVERGLFHAAHVGSFKEVCTVLTGNLDAISQRGNSEKRSEKKNKKGDLTRDGCKILDGENRDMHFSYHKLLFKKLDYFRLEGMELALMGLGWIYDIYSKSFRSHQTAGDVDVAGMKNKGKPHALLKTIASDTGEGEGSVKSVHKIPLVDKKDRISETLFHVFAEFIGPLMHDLRNFDASRKFDNPNSGFQQLVSAKIFLGAVRRILKSAQTANAYVPTEDTDNQANFKFLDKCFRTVLEIGKFLPRSLSSYVKSLVSDGSQLQLKTGDEDGYRYKIILGEIMQEVIITIKYFMELEYRVTENSLHDVWMILFAEVAIQQLSRGDVLSLGNAATHGNREAIDIACQMISIFSDLRQVDRPLFSLCATLRSCASKGFLVFLPEISSGTEAELLAEEPLWLIAPILGTVESLICAKSLLSALALAVQSLPEGQIMEFLNLLRADAMESIALIDAGRKNVLKLGSGAGERDDVLAAEALKGLTELYCHMLDNIKVTATISVQAGKAVRLIMMQIVVPELQQLIDMFVLCSSADEIATTEINISENSKSEKTYAIHDGDVISGKSKSFSKQNSVENSLNTRVFLFLVRLYMASQNLHRECISVMPPKAASKASAALDGPVIDYHKCDVTEILTLLENRSFFSAAGRGAVKVSDLLAGLEAQWVEVLEDYSALCHTLECVALQSLVEISKQVEALNFLLARCENLTNARQTKVHTDCIGKDIVTGHAESDEIFVAKEVNLAKRKKLQKLINKLKKESHTLVKVLLKKAEHAMDTSQRKRGTADISMSPTVKAGKTLNHEDLVKPGGTGQVLQYYVFQHSWDPVEATLSEDTLAIQRWQLLCRTFDVWAVHAVEMDVRKFIVFLLTSSLSAQKAGSGAIRVKDYQDSTTRLSRMKGITDELLSNAAFYEDESIRRFFSTTLLGELKRSLHSAFGKWRFDADGLDKTLEDEVIISNVVKEWAEYIRKVEGEVGEIGQEQDIKETTLFFGDHNIKGLLSASKKRGSNSITETSSSKRTRSGLRWGEEQLKALDLCIGLVDYLSGLPLGYIKSNDAASCAHMVLWFERLLVTSLLHLRVASVRSHGRQRPDHADFSAISLLLKAFSTCRTALLALTLSERPILTSPPLMGILTASFAAVHWLSLSVHVVSTCMVDIVECSKLPSNEAKHIILSGSDQIHTSLNRTASLFTYIADESLRAEAQRSLLESGPVAGITQKQEEMPFLGISSTDVETDIQLIIEVVGFQVEKLAKLIRSAMAKERTILPRGPAVSDISYSPKIWYTCLALVATLSSYFWSLNKVFDEFVGDPARSLILEIESRYNAEKLSRDVTTTLLSAILPEGSHAVYLLGELEVGTILGPIVETASAFANHQLHQQQNESMIVVNDVDDDDDDMNDAMNDAIDCPIAVDTTEVNEVDDEEDDREGDDANDNSEHLISSTDKFGKYTSESDISQELLTEKSESQRFLLEDLLEGCHREKCEVLGELYLTLAGYLRLKSKISLKINGMTGTSALLHQGSCNLTPAFNVIMGAGYWLLLKAAEKTEADQWTNLGWLVGVLKYMESMYCLLPHLKPSLSPLAFSKLFSMHVHLLGCLPLSQESLHSIKSSHPIGGEDQQGMGFAFDTANETDFQDERKVATSDSLRSAVRGSLAILLRTASRHQSVLALQFIMRALVGRIEDTIHGSGLEVGGPLGGQIGRSVASGVDCLSIALEAVSGTKRLRLLANHFNEFFGAIFNLMEYVQGPHLFFKEELPVGREILGKSKSDKNVNAGPVVLQALQILITATSRDAIFPMQACHVALALHCPARIFWPVCNSGTAKRNFMQSCSTAQLSLHNLELKNVRLKGMVVTIATELGVNLYVSCCRLLCSLIRHRRRESGHCIALLGDSARVLLHCLESPNWPSSVEVGSKIDSKVWSMKMASYCATWLRRIYEEMGEHKETLGKYCSHILSDYLSVVAGHGPNASGLTREVEAALQPGAYVLVDACSANDLQQLHAALGEGPRRNALLNLKRQYQQHFKYTGKV